MQAITTGIEDSLSEEFLTGMLAKKKKKIIGKNLKGTTSDISRSKNKYFV